jgi:Mg-chelatase subunit ChlD
MTPELPPNPRAELEAKVTAWLLGELSADEAASVREMVERDAELGRLRDRLSLTLKLLRETLATPVGETPAQPAPLKLSPERREKLLASFKTIAPVEFAQPRRWKMSWLIPLAAAAAVVLVAVIANMNSASVVLHSFRMTSSISASRDVEVPKSALDRRAPAPVMAATPPSLAGKNAALAQTPMAPAPAVPNQVALEDLRQRRLAENKPAPGTPAPSQIVLPQAGEQQIAEANNRNYDSVGGTTAGVVELEQSANKKLPETPRQAPVSDSLAIQGVQFDGAAAKDTEKTKIESGRSTFQYNLEPENQPPPGRGGAGGGGAGGAGGIGVVTSPVASAKKATESGQLALGTDSAAVTLNDSAQKDKLAKPEDLEKWIQQHPNERPSDEYLSTFKEKLERPFAPVATGSPGAAPEGAFPSSTPPATVANAARAASEVGSEDVGIEGGVVQQREKAAPAPMAAAAPAHAAERMTRTEPARRRASALTPIPDVEAPLVNNGAIGIQGGTALAATVAAAAATNEEHYTLNAVGYINVNLASNATVITEPLTEAPAAAAAPTTAWSAKEHAAGNTSSAEANRPPGLALTPLSGKPVDQADAPLPHPALPVPVPQPEVLTRNNAFTTFSLNISDVAFKLAAASLENGAMPDAASMRSEEFINAFDYRDPAPAPGAPIGFAWERAGDPFAHNRDLLRFSIKTAAQGRQAGRPLNLVLLLDKSGSMERADRVEIIANALRVLASQLQPRDTLSVVVFARTARLFADGVPGSDAGKLARQLRDLTPEGGTNLEEAMKLAYATALRHYLANGENRVVLLTDGAANLGNVDANTLKQKVETNHKQGIAFDCFGVGWDGYNDNLLETLSRAGNGRYGFINTPEEAATEFAGKLAGALRVAAADVKVQVEFNPSRVTSYRQIGYAKDQLKKEDFRDNNVKAAQIGAAESGNALYTVEINPAGEGPLGTVHVRFRVPGTSDYQEHDWTLPYTGSAVPLEKASPAMRLTATAAAFSEWLAGSPYAGEVTPDRLLGYLRGVPQVYGADARPKKLEWMIRQAKSISGK